MSETHHARESAAAPIAHMHVWTLVANALGGWLWRCHCGAYRNADGRESTGA